MLGSAQRGEFDVLLVGYVSRWQRNLRRTLELLEDTLHPAGVPVYFCDEEILSSSERHWDQLVDEAKDAERYSRRLSRRIREGYASKRARERDPGGRPPFGFRRNAAKLLEPDPERLPTVTRVFELAAAGLPDRAVAEAAGLPLFTVRGILTSPLYAGRLRDGEPARWPALVPSALWDAAQAARARRATKTGRPADPRRPYALDMLHCAACGRRLTGDTGYYRHREPCPPFTAARPEHRGRGQSPGHAYRRELYEQIVEGLLAEASLGAGAIAGVVGEVGRAAPAPDRSVPDRIARERERAMARYLRDRDAAALDRTMVGLDREQAAADNRRPTEAIPADVAVRLRPGAARDLAQGRGRSWPPAARERPVRPHRGAGDPGGDRPPQRARGAARPCGGATGGAGNTRKWSGREALRRDKVRTRDHRDERSVRAPVVGSATQHPCQRAASSSFVKLRLRAWAPRTVAR